MVTSYLEHLDDNALELLAETTGIVGRGHARSFFRSRPHDIHLALTSPEASSLLGCDGAEIDRATNMLRIAVSVHRTAEAICHEGWSASVQRPIDLPLLRMAGQIESQQFLVGVLASFLEEEDRSLTADFSATPTPVTLERLFWLVGLAEQVSPLERAGALRLLGDEALFGASVFTDLGANQKVGPGVVAKLAPVLPRAVTRILPQLETQLWSLLDIHLMFGPIWYRLASKELLYPHERSVLGHVAGDFAAMRKFAVTVTQGPLANIRDLVFNSVLSDR